MAGLLAGSPGRAVGVTLGEPAPGQFGVADGVLVDHPVPHPRSLGPAGAVRPAGAHNVANALPAAALARAFGATAEAVAAGLAGYRPEPHRNEFVATVGGVAYVDDSKATNPHAAYASLARTRAWSGSPAASSRASTWVTWSPASPTGWSRPSCSASTGTQVAEALARHAPAGPGRRRAQHP